MNDLAKHLSLLGSKVKAQSEPFSGFVESIAFDKYGLISALVTSCDYKAGTTPDAKWFAVDDLTATSLHFSAGSIERFFVDWFSGNTHYPVCVCGSCPIPPGRVRLRIVANLSGLFTVVRVRWRKAAQPEQLVWLPVQATRLAYRPERRF